MNKKICFLIANCLMYLCLPFAAHALEDEDCVPINSSALAINTSSDGTQLELSDGFSILLSFELTQRDEAETAKAIIEYYGFTEQCFVGRPDSSMMYWLVNGQTPQGSYTGEDCIPMRNLELQVIDGRWTIVQVTDTGTIYFLEFGSNEAEAREALDIITRRGFEYQCFVGRANASMEYYRTDPDSDGDGLLDTWERFGFDADGDGSVDIDLPAMGADPNHKDLFLEFDWMTGQAPTQAAIRAMKQAFAAAPIDAGGVPNPDGLPGINLWVDTGNLTDANGMEDGNPAGSCSDGIDNGTDGLIDANDPDCLVGDNLGGGNSMAASDIANLNTNFYAAKGANFNNNRAMIFRYGISARPGGFGGGWGEIGGNDFIEYNHDGGTIMHELGHTLNLRHGGDVNDNCKPNFVSVMNYDNQFRINQAGGGRIIDYSPPRFAGGRGIAPLATLVENSLNEATILDNTDATNQFVFVNSTGAKVRSQLNQPVDWNGDGDTNDSSLAVNIDTSSAATGQPAACTNGSSTDTLNGHDDWSNIVLNFRPFGDSANGAINPVTEQEPDLQTLQLMDQQLNTTDVQITKTDTPDPVEVGSQVTYNLIVKNNGPNPADKVQVTDTLPSNVSTIRANGCDEGPVGTIVCNLGSIPAMGTQQVEVLARVNAMHIDPATGPTVLTNNSSVENLAGPDPILTNNNASQNTTVVDTTPPNIVPPPAVTLEANAQCTAGGDIGVATATDIGDPNPDITNDSTGVFQLGENIVTWTATDDSGNSSTAEQIITVIDVTPPTITATVNPDLLWPPNHKLVSITPNLTVADNCGVAGTQLESITMNEGDESSTYDPNFDTTQGDGNTTNDIQVAPDGTISLRAERSGTGVGRLYTLIFSVTDTSGNRAEDSTSVSVPHSN